MPIDGSNNVSNLVKRIAAQGGNVKKIDTESEIFKLSSLLSSSSLVGADLSDNEKLYIKGLVLEAEKSLSNESAEVTAKDNKTPENNEVPEEGKAAEKKQADGVIERFKALDKDGDLKVSAKEYTDSIVAEYMSSGELPAGYDNIADYLDAKFEEFKRFAGDDVSMNIDEFRSMFEARLNAAKEAKEAKEMQKPPTETVNTPSTKESTPEKNADGRAINPDHPNTEALPNTPVQQAASTPDKTKDGEEI